MTGNTLAEDANQDTAAAAGTIIGGGLVTGFYAIVGLFAGLIFLILGLLIGRNKKVIYIDRDGKTSEIDQKEISRADQNKRGRRERMEFDEF